RPTREVRTRTDPNRFGVCAIVVDCAAMKVRDAVVMILVTSAIAAGAASQDKPQLPKSQMPDLGRPTRVGDEQPPFNFGEYFIGRWTSEWDAPEGPFGPSGTIKGTTIYKAIDDKVDRFYEATTSAQGPGGAFTTKETIAYRAEGKTAARSVIDSRGFSYMQMAAVGGDLGGYFNLYFESTPFVYKGKTLRIKNAIRVTSPLRYRNAITVSTDGGPFLNYGTVWFEKDASSS